MASSPPALLKSLNKFLIQARKLDKVHPVAAYYCRYYFLRKALGLVKGRDDAGDAKEFIGSLVTVLEKAKPSLPEDKDEKQQMVESFAESVFDIADDEDRAGNATKKTAITFRSSSLLFEVCSIFGDLSEELSGKLKYSRWKTVDIIKAIKEGRKPTPGPPGGEPEPEPEEPEQPEQQQPHDHLLVVDDSGGQGGVSGAMSHGVDATSYYRREEDMSGGASAPPEPTAPVVAAVVPEQSPAAVPSSQANIRPAYAPQSQPQIVPTTKKAERKQQRAHQYSAASAAPAPVYNSTGMFVRAKASEDKIAAEIQAERLIGHAQSALRFHDIDGAIEKMVGALAVLLPYKGQTS